jgi:O-antigen/teichoic acid export membrane protein
MEKAFEMGKASATGSFQLLIGVAMSTIIMAVGTIILGRLMTTEEYGLYGIVLIPLTTINLFRDWGINSAIIKYIASLRASQKGEEIYDIITAGLVFDVASGIALSFFSLALATFIASTVFHRPESAFFIEIVSVSIISGSLLTASQAVFVGFERMELSSFTLICQAIVKTAVSPVLVFLGYSVLGAVIGYTLSFIAAGTIGLATFYFTLFRPLRKKRTAYARAKTSNFFKTLKTMLNYGVPLSVSAVLGNILGQVYALTVPSFVSNTLYGNYATAANFSILLTFLTVPIGTVLFPAFAKLDPDNEHELVKTVFASSIKYTSMLLVPATIVIMALSGPMIGTLYGEKYVYGPFFLTIVVIGNLFALFGNVSSGSLLSGLGKTRILMIQSIATLIIGLPIGFLLIPMLGITGLIIANTIAGLPSMFWGLYWIWKHYKARADFQSSAKILVASAIAAFMAYLPTIFLNTTNWMKLIIGLIIFLTVYVLGAPIIGAVSLTDIKNLRNMFSGMGVISKITYLLLNVAEKAAQFKVTNKKAGEKS